MPLTTLMQIDATVHCDAPGCPAEKRTTAESAQELVAWLNKDGWKTAGDSEVGPFEVFCPDHAAEAEVRHEYLSKAGPFLSAFLCHYAEVNECYASGLALAAKPFSLDVPHLWPGNRTNEAPEDEKGACTKKALDNE